MNCFHKCVLTIVMLLVLLLGAVGSASEAQSNGPLFLGLGDSIGESVQSADASHFTQPFSYLHLMALMMGAEFPLPLIQTNLFGRIGSTAGRSRIDPGVEGLNLAVSGANAHDLLFTRADAATVDQIDSETDMVLFPRQASQIEIAEALRPQLVACWIGNNDALAAVTDFDQLDGVSHLTPLPEFTANFTQIAARLAAIGSKVIFATIPDVTKIGYLLDNQDLMRLLGSDFGLPDGSRTTLVVMLGLQLGDLDPNILSNPNFVLDSSEAANINRRISEFNDVIKYTAAVYGMGVADVATLFDVIATSPPTVLGVPFTPRFLGGLFSLDGVHPSNFTHALVAQKFLQIFNSHYGLAIPTLPDSALLQFFLTDPFIDKDGDGRVRGRLGAGLLETVAVLLGRSGDLNDAIPPGAASTDTPDMTRFGENLRSMTERAAQ